MALYAREYALGVAPVLLQNWSGQDPSFCFDPLINRRVVLLAETIAVFCIADAQHKSKPHCLRYVAINRNIRGNLNANDTAADPQTKAAKN